MGVLESHDDEDRRTLDLLAALLDHLARLNFPKLTPLEIAGATAVALERFVPLDEAARLRGISEDTLEREDPDKIVRLSERRKGMRIRHALMIPES